MTYPNKQLSGIREIIDALAADFVELEAVIEIVIFLFVVKNFSTGLRELVCSRQRYASVCTPR
ncbi:MAG: hypothetical protein CL474_03445 [Acidobacteria bacterium]|nr:hypothetical protein [Acidobacteriota bacterium]